MRRWRSISYYAIIARLIMHAFTKYLFILQQQVPPSAAWAKQLLECFDCSCDSGYPSCARKVPLYLRMWACLQTGLRG